MIARKAYKYRLKTNDEQAAQLRCFAGHCRFVWNRMLAEQKARLENGESCEKYNTFAKYLPVWKANPEFGWLKEAPSAALQQKLKDLDRALKDAFDKKQPDKRFPKFKKRGCGDSFRIPQPSQFKIENNRIQLPKIGWVRFLKSRAIQGTPKQVTVSQQSSHWYISVQVEFELPKKVHQSSSAIGVDMGVSKLFALSNGEVIAPVNSFKTYKEKLAKAQKKLSKKKKFSSGWKKQKAKVQKTHSKIANIRRDYLHKATTQLSKNHATIVIEDLQVKNMSASAKGDLENPGKNVKAKSRLNKSILDQGWFEARRQLDYKQQWRNGILVTVPAQYTSQKCAQCGHVEKANRASQASFKCQSCGYTANADMNAAMNILAAGHAVIAGGAEPLGAAVKPEPLVA